MGAGLSSSGMGGGGSRRVRRGGIQMAPMTDINVTPFVDVMLVLLIVFMVAAPMLTVSVPLDLPQTGASAKPDDQPLVVSVQQGGKLFIGEEEVTDANLVERLNALAKNGLDQRIFIRGDKAVDYGRMVTVLGALSVAGFRKIGLVSSVLNQ